MQNKELIQHAAYAAIERILNEYFREENLYQVPPQNHQWSIQLSELETLTGEFRYWSAMGHHMYHPEVWLIDGKSKKITTYKEAIARILQHMAQSADNQTQCNNIWRKLCLTSIIAFIARHVIAK